VNNAKFQGIYNGMTSICKKVYAAVPINEPWTPSQVLQEMFRAGSSSDLRMVSGCLNTLVGSGVIVENPRGSFARVAVKPPRTPLRSALDESLPTPPATKEPIVPVNLPLAASAQTPPEPQSAIDKLARLSSRAVDIATALKQLASDIDSAAIEIEDQIAAKGEDAKKLTQLRELLKGIG